MMCVPFTPHAGGDLVFLCRPIQWQDGVLSTEHHHGDIDKKSTVFGIGLHLPAVVKLERRVR